MENYTTPPSNISNTVNSDDIPDAMKEKITRILEICVYFVFFFIGAPANARVLIILLRNGLYLKSRHYKLLTNLAAADTMTCFIMIPAEIAWRITGYWRAGDIGCKLFAVFRIFGLYASSMILIVISIDRYYAVSHPFEYSTMGGRIDSFLITSWVISALLSMAQAYIFRAMQVPGDPNERKQCVGFDAFPHPWMEVTYTFVSLCMLYWLPLLAIITCYTVVYVRSIYQQKKSAAIKNQQQLRLRSTASNSETMKTDDEKALRTAIKLEAISSSTGSNLRLESIGQSNNTGVCSSTAALNANASAAKPVKSQRDLKKRILRQTLIIVLTFIICWTPYVIMATWYQVDFQSASKAHFLINSVFFLFAVSNSIIDPFIYGKFVKDNPQRV